jgi:hypothetical protein
VVRTVIEDAGFLVIVTGVALLSVAAAVILGGLLLVLAANLHAGRRRPVEPVEDEQGPVLL